MDGQEHDELLYRLDERTERIEKEHLRRLENVEDNVARNYGLIQTIDDRVQRNETKINIASGSMGAVAAGIAAWTAKALGLLRGII